MGPSSSPPIAACFCRKQAQQSLPQKSHQACDRPYSRVWRKMPGVGTKGVLSVACWGHKHGRPKFFIPDRFIPDTALRHNDANVHIAFSAFSSILLIENAPKNKPETCEAAQQLSGADTKGSVISACTATPPDFSPSDMNLMAHSDPHA